MKVVHGGRASFRDRLQNRRPHKEHHANCCCAFRRSNFPRRRCDQCVSHPHHRRRRHRACRRSGELPQGRAWRERHCVKHGKVTRLTDGKSGHWPCGMANICKPEKLAGGSARRLGKEDEPDTGDGAGGVERFNQGVDMAPNFDLWTIKRQSLSSKQIRTNARA